MKKSWEKPELIIIVRTEIEENVLAGCKANQSCMEGAAGANRPATS